uniref:Uncharacterized protein n=1 Tax=Rhizophagus irregularis (strain DAOM 181602 / DAOM 197198 / MUCL 43194) TaxID=747089 RepID=U9THW7_RHIID
MYILISNFAISRSSIILTEISHFEIFVIWDLNCFSNIRDSGITYINFFIDRIKT